MTVTGRLLDDLRQLGTVGQIPSERDLDGVGLLSHLSAKEDGRSDLPEPCWRGWISG